MPDTVPLIRVDGSESLGIALPKDELERRGIQAGDTVVLVPSNDPDSFTRYMPPPD